MTFYSKILLGTLLVATTFAYPILAVADETADKPADLYYKYANNEAEYSVVLPEAPSVETIWSDTGRPPYQVGALKDGAIGEIATFKQVDADTEDYFEVKITYLKASRGFLAGLTDEKIREILQNDYKSLPLTGAKFTYSVGSGKDALKWAAVTGFAIGKDNKPLFHTTHYLTGKQSIMVIRVTYNIDNKNFQGYYKNLVEHITYHAP